jgi:hypothetical protein
VIGQLHSPAALPQGKEPPGIQWIRGWVNPRVSLDDVERNRKFEPTRTRTTTRWSSIPQPVAIPTALPRLLFECISHLKNSPHCSHKVRQNVLISLKHDLIYILNIGFSFKKAAMQHHKANVVYFIGSCGGRLKINSEYSRRQ